MANVADVGRELPPALRDARFLPDRSARTAGHVEQMAGKFESAVSGVIQREIVSSLEGCKVMVCISQLTVSE